MAQTNGNTLRLWLQDRFLRGLIWALMRLPYRWRVPLCGAAVTHLVAPVAGYRKRIRENLAYVLPELAPVEVERIVRAVPDNVGRTIIEIYSGAEFAAHAMRHPLTGGGVAALEAAHQAGQPVILVTGHFGNYDASRAALVGRGYRVGSLYMPMTNPYFNAHYEAAIAAIGKPMFPRGKAGLGAMVRHLRSGGMVGMVVDQNMNHGAPLKFFGKTALTALSAAELALKYNALLVPTYGIRSEDGLSFTIVVEPPVPQGTPEAMTQALNDSLEVLARQHLDQWFWIHRRWKGGQRFDGAAGSASE
ncbi:lysophospholipid acyltransferase family protein [Xinfangfangia sp. CPCC 101601]|uniref:Lysophospholipid acyltransferase family protein n=1 Tax=Pseudogemmobacter lacusdianii TaxID=3069608 RepID=A0ABU0VXY0_9RHOB|nr:lysophospholipid acyltransferase family protein [Xinfangfangia sp. CPCC 101601]MDQ2066601.1 lysophospholipid acyltransferase family protein [Xinfangfangia sp. CPCC 101601]